MAIYFLSPFIQPASYLPSPSPRSPSPQYGFAQHKGYPTRQHKQAVFEHGACAIHRLTFAPLKSMSLEQLKVPEPRWKLLQQRLQERQKKKTTKKRQKKKK